MKKQKRLAQLSLKVTQQLEELDNQIKESAPDSKLVLFADAYRYHIVLTALKQATRK